MADSLLNIRDMRASIVLGKDMDKRIRISARSLGDVNVQRIMEELGGGGHFTMAGAQMDTSMEEALERVKEIAGRFMAEEEEKKLAQAKSQDKKSETKRLQMQAENKSES